MHDVLILCGGKGTRSYPFTEHYPKAMMPVGGSPIIVHLMRIYADGHLIVLSDRGTLVQVEATSDGYVEKGRVQALDGKCWTAPALAGGKVYLRSHTEIVSYDLKTEE